jgi:hypothetical protein
MNQDCQNYNRGTARQEIFASLTILLPLSLILTSPLQRLIPLALPTATPIQLYIWGYCFNKRARPLKSGCRGQ